MRLVENTAGLHSNCSGSICWHAPRSARARRCTARSVIVHASSRDAETVADITVTRREWLTHVFPSIAALATSVALLPPAALAASPKLATPSPDIAAEVKKAMNALNLRGKAPVMLRLVFHDAGTYRAASRDGGLNASIQFELDRPENKGLKRAWNVVQDLHKQLQGTPAAGLSKADLIAWVGAEVVALTGGPSIPIVIGRQDATVADPGDRLPPESLSAAGQLDVFASMGLSPTEMVALLGSHTLGGKGFGDPLTFDATYYRTLLQKPWNDPKVEMSSMIGIPTDRVLPDDPVCRPIIERFAQDQDAFFREFVTAYGKMTRLGTA